MTRRDLGPRWFLLPCDIARASFAARARLARALGLSPFALDRAIIAVANRP